MARQINKLHPQRRKKRRIALTVEIPNGRDDEVEEIKSRTLRKMQKEAKVRQNQVEAAKTLGGKAIDLTDSNFYSTVNKYPLMLIDFWAPWCMPCRMVSPAVDELAKQYTGRVAFGRVNVDENPITANQFGVQGIPTLMLFQHGKAVDRLVGAYPKNMIDAQIRAHLGSDSG
jgi:thioredoxin 1